MAQRVNLGVFADFMSVIHSENLLMCYNMNSKFMLRSNKAISLGRQKDETEFKLEGGLTKPMVRTDDSRFLSRDLALIVAWWPPHIGGR